MISIQYCTVLYYSNAVSVTGCTIVTVVPVPVSGCTFNIVAPVPVAGRTIKTVSPIPVSDCSDADPDPVLWIRICIIKVGSGSGSVWRDTNPDPDLGHIPVR